MFACSAVVCLALCSVLCWATAPSLVVIDSNATLTILNSQNPAKHTSFALQNVTLLLPQGVFAAQSGRIIAP